MTMINKKTHSIEWQDLAEEPWQSGDWIVVPEELERKAKDSGGCCTLIFDNDGNLTDIILLEKPAPQEPEPTEEEKLRADVDYLAALQGVTL